MSILSASRASLVLILFVLSVLVVVGKTSDAGSASQQCANICNLKNGYCGPDGKCRCFEGWTGKNCNQCVRAVGCRHGTCQNPGECICKQGYGGRHCQLDMTYCQRQRPCKNGATCENDGHGSYTCTCTSGFSGKTCSIRLNPLIRFPVSTRNAPKKSTCLNGGTCITSYCEKCRCPKGFVGNMCETRVQMCVTRPCANGAKCHNLLGDYDCECASGYHGRRCEKDVNECSILGKDACENGGRCVNIKGSYSCRCPDGFEGVRCDKRVQRIQNPPSATTTVMPELPPSSGKDFSSLKNLLKTKVKSSSHLIHKMVPGKKSTNIKVVEIVRHVEVESINSDSSDRFENKQLANLPDVSDQPSDSIVQAVTIAFLSVAFLLFVVIVLVVWLHRRKKKKLCCVEYKDKNQSKQTDERDNRRSVIVERECDEPTTIVASQSKLGKAVYEVAPQCGLKSTNTAPHADTLYVALPSDTLLNSSNLRASSEICSTADSSISSRLPSYYECR